VIVNWTPHRTSGRVAAALCRAWDTGRFSPDITTARWARSGAGSGMASRYRDRRGDVHDLANQYRDLEAFAAQLKPE